MRKLGILWGGLLLLCGTMWAQSEPDSVCEVNLTAAKAGAAKQWEAARKQHNVFHQTEKDPNSIIVWSIMTGPNTGKYMTTVCNQTWKGMDGHDAFDQRDEADRQKTMAGTSESNQQSFYVFRKDLSSDKGDGPPPKMITVVHYFVKPAGIAQFTDSLKRINAAAAQAKWAGKPSRVYGLVNGGEGPHFVIVTDRTSWSDMQGPEQSLMDVLKQVYGADDKTIQTLREAVDHTMSEMLEYRADLSYVSKK